MSEVNNNKIKTIHKIIINNRETIVISGIKEIIDYDENEVNLKSNLGNICIEGEKIQINILNVSSGDLELTGKINGIFYSNTDDGDKHSLLSKIFK